MEKRILVVDDEADILKMASFRLKKAGYEVLTAACGRDAIDLAYKMLPDLILLDLVLPDIKGDEVCRQLKSDEKTKHIPIVLFTAGAMKDLVLIVKDSKAQGYLVKPFDYRELLSKVTSLIGPAQGVISDE